MYIYIIIYTYIYIYIYIYICIYIYTFTYRPGDVFRAFAEGGEINRASDREISGRSYTTIEWNSIGFNGNEWMKQDFIGSGNI